MAIRTYKASQIVADGSGAGTVTSTRIINGLLMAIKVVQGATPKSTSVTTVTISDGVTSQTLLITPAASTASKWYYPRVLEQDTSGADITGQYTLLPLNGAVTIALAGGNANQTDDVSIMYADDDPHT